MSICELTEEQVAAFAQGLPERSVIFAAYDDVGMVARSLLVARRADIDVLHGRAIPPGHICGKSPYALAVGEDGWWLPERCPD
jgi:hypothetical protein